MSNVIVVIGAGSIGRAIARRVSAGKHVLLADLRQENASAAAEVLSNAGFDVSTATVDVSSRDSIHKLVEDATKLGDVTGVIHAAGVSPSQASPATIMKVDLYGTAVVLEEFGAVIARGGAGVVIASQSGHRLGALTAEQNAALAMTPAEALLSLPMLQPDQVEDSLHAYQLAKRGNVLRVMAEAVKWGKRGARVTIHHILVNRAYIGEWTFGKKRWRKDPISRKRRYTSRAEKEVHHDTRPHLRIVSADVWSAVESRRKAVGENHSGRSHGAPSGKVRHPFSGLLHCSECGHRMTDAGGTSARYYRCSGASSGGICPNLRPVREDVLVEAAIAELRRMFTETTLHEKMMTKIAEKLKTFSVEARQGSTDIERELATKRAEIERLMNFIRSTDLAASPGAFDTVRVSLEKTTVETRALEARLAATNAMRTETPRLPTVDELAVLVLDLEGRIADDPTSAREALRQSLENGRLHMKPMPDRAYRAHSIVFPMRLYWRMRMKKPRADGSGEASGGTVGTVSCAGPIRSLQHAVFKAFSIRMVA